MQAVSSEAAQVGHSTETLVEITRLLALDESSFVKLQLKKAVELHDPARMIHREIRLKELYLEQHSAEFDPITRYRKVSHATS